MSSTQQVLAAGPPLSVKGPRRPRRKARPARHGFEMGDRLCPFPTRRYFSFSSFFPTATRSGWRASRRFTST